MKSYRLTLARLLVSATLFAGGAHAADRNPDAVRAEALFDEGRRLMQAGDFNAACPKLAESQTLDPAPGTALNLATCYEKAGKLASAWAAYRTAEAVSSSAKQKDRAAFAKKKVAALQPKVSRLSINVPSTSAVNGLQIQLDDQAVQMPEWGVPVPHDGGSYTVQASAPSKVTWVSHVVLEPSGQNLVVDVPTLTDAPKPAPLPRASMSPATTTTTDTDRTGSSAPTTETRGKTQRTVAYLIGGVGLAGLGAASVIGLLAKSKYDKANALPKTDVHRIPDSQKATNLGNVGTIVASAGGALAATGIIVWLTAPRNAVTVGTDGSELFLTGCF